MHALIRAGHKGDFDGDLLIKLDPKSSTDIVVFGRSQLAKFLNKVSGVAKPVLDFAGEAAKIPGQVDDLFRLVDRLMSKVKDKVPQLVQALYDDPTKIAGNIIEGLKNGFTEFFTKANFDKVIDKVLNWALEPLLKRISPADLQAFKDRFTNLKWTDL